jgi:hypothetical protein
MTDPVLTALERVEQMLEAELRRAREQSAERRLVIAAQRRIGDMSEEAGRAIRDRGLDGARAMVEGHAPRRICEVRLSVTGGHTTIRQQIQRAVDAQLPRRPE